ncbi:hypothetical protein [Rickettsia endosymbiont of Urophora cardui]|uniref:hypothetical protein n=1 Tax=Rickettsia endosymbiont of Urophora cardui TaxID=3066265 RepID=UPI00313AC58B
MDKDENDITIYTYDPQGRMSSVSIGNVRIEKTHSNNSLNSNESILLNEIEEKKDNYNDEDLEIISITADTDSLKEHKDSDNNSQTKILDSEKESDCGTFDCMGKNDDFYCIIT